LPFSRYSSYARPFLILSPTIVYSRFQLFDCVNHVATYTVKTFSLDCNSRFYSIRFMLLDRSVNIHPHFSLANWSVLESILSKKHRWIIITMTIVSMEKVADWFSSITWLDFVKKQCIQIASLYSASMLMYQKFFSVGQLPSF